LKQQEGSYDAQVDYYTNKINSNPNWRCAGIFADDGKSATQTRKREDFNINKGNITMEREQSVALMCLWNRSHDCQQ
jgi:hypothetical protein